jgi:hypothetical protein
MRDFGKRNLKGRRKDTCNDRRAARRALGHHCNSAIADALGSLAGDKQTGLPIFAA